ncbi:hypothetical protein [Corynebacterium mayonis]|uniref:hypothetical protein n=1 Tax=Corynebacterium mayonis TaxID=3062461 RepID=UPI0031405A88
MNKDNSAHPDDYEYVDAYPDDEPEEYRGSHRAEDTGVATKASSSATSGAMPKRGLGMILIAIAAILLLWGIYALTQDKGESTDESITRSQASSAAPESSQTAPMPEQAQEPQPDAAQPNPAEGTEQLPGEAAPAPGLSRENANVLVFNNSPIPDLANQTAEQLSRDYMVGNRTNDPARMNLPEQQFGIFPETAVFFDPAVPGAEQIAADIAQRVGGRPLSIHDVPPGAALPNEATANGNAVTVVLAG